MVKLRGCFLANCIGSVSRKKRGIEGKLQCCCVSNTQYVLKNNDHKPDTAKDFQAVNCDDIKLQ